MSIRPSRAGAVVAGLTAAVVLVAVAASPASAATTRLWAGWATTGPTSFVVQVANTPPMTATVTTDSRQGGIGVISGASTWLAAGTPVGAKYGSSQGRPYLNLRPKADNALSPSTTTYSFAQPTPASGWTFVLGDIDADKVQIRAVTPGGATLTAAQLGFRGGFNYCAPGLAGKPSCTGSATDIPSWDPASLTLTGNAAAVDTDGSAAWFEPSVPLASLTFVYTQRSGLPIFQTWFASLARDITGTVSATTGSPEGATLTLRDANGVVVGTTTSAADGSYSFPGVQATSSYTVSVTPPAGMIVTGPASVPADLSTTDAVADFTMRTIVPVAVGGTVRDTGGNPVPGATVQLAPGVTTTTGPDGSYLFDTAEVGSYDVTVTAVPAGFTVVTPPQTVTVPAGTETPITGVDFTVRADPDLSGTVTEAGVGVAGVVVTATGPSGTLSTVTAADGGYTFPMLPAGDYTVTVTPPPGSTVSGPGSRNETVAAADVTGVDFALGRTGGVAGTVTGPSGPVPGTDITVTGPDGPVTTLTTDAAGQYAVTDLPPGDYTIAVTPPAGFTVSGTTTHTVTITDAGDAVTGQDFALAAAPTPPPTTPPATPPAAPPPGAGTTPSSSGSGTLADTGSDTGGMVGGALAAVVLVGGGAGAAVAGTRAKRRGR